MRYPYSLICLLAAVLLISNCSETARAAVDTQQLHDGWQYRQADAVDWSSAMVPGCVHTDLLAEGRIKDPSYRLNEKLQQWVGYSDWEYRTTFQIDNETLAKQHNRLVFEGLDTYADVYLNDKLILSANNMFRTWKVDCKEHLKQGENRLRVYFHNVFKKTLPLHEQAPFELQAFRNNDQARVKLNMYSRKAGFHFGWDWGPRLITCGVWRPVTLESWDDVRIENVFYEQTYVSTKRAEITAHLQVNANSGGAVQARIRHGDKLLATKQVVVEPGEKSVDVDFVIDNPRLWWTHDLGDQPLYEFTAEVESDRSGVDRRQTKIGIRDLKVVRERDEHGIPMTVVLNGVPLFIKGANYIPQDNFQSRVTKAGYEFYVGAARDANMNMLRVWGGGIYEEDLFYELCDQKGVLVWQDTMFACAMYPADDDFLANVRAEVIDNATRLRNHPSLALYCGNNEVEISWHEWGWKKKYNKEEQKAYEANLHKLFYETIPDALSDADPTRYYHPSSPITGYSDRPNLDGDVHYWGVWHGKEPFENFQENVGRFMSEYGFQSYPDIATVARYTQPSDRDLSSDVMHAHQRSMADEGKDVDYGNRLINEYMEKYFPAPKGFANHLQMTQLVQAYGVREAIVSHRRRKPYCMGTLYWQINDCWPVASWSSIDYYGRWKALHYEVKRAYADIVLPTVQRGDEVEIYLASDRPGEDATASLKMTLMDFSGSKLWEKSQEVGVTNREGRLLAKLQMTDLPGVSAESHFLRVQLIQDGQVIASANHCFAYPKHLKLLNPQFQKSVKQAEDGYEITLTAERFTRYAHFATNDGKGHFSDSFFDMQPGESRTVQLTTDQRYDDPSEAITVHSLFDLTAPPEVASRN